MKNSRKFLLKKLLNLLVKCQLFCKFILRQTKQVYSDSTKQNSKHYIRAAEGSPSLDLCLSQFTALGYFFALTSKNCEQ